MAKPRKKKPETPTSDRTRSWNPSLQSGNFRRQFQLASLHSDERSSREGERKRCRVYSYLSGWPTKRSPCVAAKRSKARLSDLSESFFSDWGSTASRSSVPPPPDAGMALPDACGYGANPTLPLQPQRLHQTSQDRDRDTQFSLSQLSHTGKVDVALFKH